MNIHFICLMVLLMGCTHQPPVKSTQQKAVMTSEEYITGDLNRDGSVNSSDIAIFNKVVGESETGSNYNELADADHDGSITEKDRSILFPRNLNNAAQPDAPANGAGAAIAELHVRQQI